MPFRDVQSLAETSRPVHFLQAAAPISQQDSLALDQPVNHFPCRSRFRMTASRLRGTRLPISIRPVGSGTACPRRDLGNCASRPRKVRGKWIRWTSRPLVAGADATTLAPVTLATPGGETMSRTPTEITHVQPWTSFAPRAATYPRVAEVAKTRIPAA